MDPLAHLPTPGRARVLVDGLDHPEGVAYDPAAGVIWAGGEAGQLYRVHDDSFEEVARAALQNASSVASLILTTDAMVAELPKEEPAMGGHGHGGMGGMGGMDM